MSRLRRLSWLPAAGAALLLGAALGACNSDAGYTPPDPVGPVAFFKLTPESYYQLPFPNALRQNADGSVDLDGFAGGTSIVEGLLQTAVEQKAGFAVGGAIFFRFETAIDASTLPAPGAEARDDPSASVYVVDIDPSSPEYGTRYPLWLKFSPTASRFIGDNWLGLLPHPGHPLRGGTTYAAVITSRLLTADGQPFSRDRDFDWIMTRDGPSNVRAARVLYQPLLDYLDAQGIPRDEVVSATVFTTQQVTDFIHLARDVVRRDVPTPSLANLTVLERNPDFNLYEGTYQAPIFQQGTAPYRNDGGEILVNAFGEPEGARVQTLRVALSVPTGTMPVGGWPVVMYAHGTGGDYLTFHQNGTAGRFANVMDDQGQTIAKMAVVGIDGVLHGDRAVNGSPAELFYNVTNPIAGRDNSRQAAIDYFHLTRLVEAIDVAQAPLTRDPIKFDLNRIYYMGHSQGGITGVLFVVAEPRVRAAVLSGTGAHLLLTLLRKDTEFNIPAALSIALSDGRYGEVDEFHPVLTFVQMFIEPSDPLTYARQYAREVPAGSAPRNLLLTYGVGDTYTPPITIETLATAIGTDTVGTLWDPLPLMELDGPITPLTPPVCHNLITNGGTATSLLAQYRPTFGDDGHFVAFDVQDARRQTTAFLATDAAQACPTLIP